MFLAGTYEGLLIVAAGLGLGKGFRTVYWGLVIPDYVPLKKYPSAAAFQSLCNGILLLLSGPLIGKREFWAVIWYPCARPALSKRSFYLFQPYLFLKSLFSV